VKAPAAMALQLAGWRSWP